MHVLFRVKQTTCALPAEAAMEMVHGGSVKLTPMPGPPELLGVVDVRGMLIPLVELRPLLGLPPNRVEVEEIRGMIAARERDHVEWLADLRQCAHTGAPFSRATDPSKCAFGSWYDGVRSDPARLGALTGNRLAQLAAVQSWDVHHRAIHGLAALVLDRSKDGDTAGADALLESGHRSLAALQASFAEFLHLLDEQRKSMLILYQVDERRVAIAVDEVEVVQDLDPARIVPLPTTSATSSVLSGMYRSPSGAVVLLVDPVKVARQVLESAALDA